MPSPFMVTRQTGRLDDAETLSATERRTVWANLGLANQYADRLLLGIMGAMSEAELHWLRNRLLGGKLARAEQGVLLGADVGELRLDDLEVAQVLPFEKGLRDYLKSKHADLIKRIEDTKELSKDDEGLLHTAVKDFKKSGAY